MEFLRENWFRGGIVLSLTLAALSLLYFFVFFLPQKERSELDLRRKTLRFQERKVEELRKAEMRDKELARERARQRKLEAEEESLRLSTMLKTCRSFAQVGYDLAWANACRTNAAKIKDGYERCIGKGLGQQSCRDMWGTPDSGDDCELPSRVADNLDKTLRADQAECDGLYSKKKPTTSADKSN